MRKLLLSILSFSLFFQSAVLINAEEAEEENVIVQNETAIQAESFSSDQYTIWLKPGETKQIEYTLYPKNSEGTIQWSYEYGDSGILSVDENGMIHAEERTGCAHFSGTLENGFSQTYVIYVSEDPESLLVSDENRNFKIKKGDSRYVGVNAKPSEAFYCRKHVISSDSEVASVSNEWTDYGFNIYAQNEGFSEITVTADNGVKTVLNVEVVDGNFANSISPVESEVWLKRGETKQLEYILEPADAIDEVEWSTDSWRPCVAVDENGVVTALENGTGRVTAKILNGSCTYVIHVSEDPESISCIESILLPTDVNKYITLSVTPNTARECRKHITVDHPEIVSVNKEWTSDTNISIIGKQAGKAVVTITADNGVSCSIEVEVADGIANSISGQYTPVWVNQGESKQLEYSLYPSSATEKPVFVSNDPELVSVDENGIVTALGNQGKAIVTAAIRNGSSTSYSVLINENPQKMRFDQDEYHVRAGRSVTPTLIFEPFDLLHSHIQYSSDNADVADFYDSGMSAWVTTKSPGTAILTAVAENGVSATAKVYVEDGYASGIQAGQSEVYMDKGDVAKLQYSLFGSGNTGKEVLSWKVISGPDVVSVDEDGNVTADSYGTATVAAVISSFYLNGAKAYDLYSYSGNDVAKFTIYVGNQPETLNFPKDHYEIVKGESLRLYALSDCGESEYSLKEYSSSDPSVVSISKMGLEAVVYGAKAGTAVITANTENGVSAETTVTVIDSSAAPYSASDVGMNFHHPCLYTSEELNLKELISTTDFDPDDPSITWISSNEKTATVENGVVEAVSAGTAVIMAVGSEGNICFSYQIFVSDPEVIHFTENDIICLPVRGLTWLMSCMQTRL